MVTFFTMEVLLKTNNMKISELINKLQEIQNKYGDVEIMYYFHGEGEKFTYYEIDYNKDDNKLYLG